MPLETCDDDHLRSIETCASQTIHTFSRRPSPMALAGQKVLLPVPMEKRNDDDSRQVVAQGAGESEARQREEEDACPDGRFEEARQSADPTVITIDITSCPPS
jgi:hypothetical protein